MGTVVAHGCLCARVAEPFGARRGWGAGRCDGCSVRSVLATAQRPKHSLGRKKGVWENRGGALLNRNLPASHPTARPSFRYTAATSGRTRLRAELEERASASVPRSGSSRLCRAGRLKNGWLGWERGACAWLLQNVAWSGRRLRVRPSLWYPKRGISAW